jgi:hypothetical protein
MGCYPLNRTGSGVLGEGSPTLLACNNGINGS